MSSRQQGRGGGPLSGGGGGPRSGSLGGNGGGGRASGGRGPLGGGSGGGCARPSGGDRRTAEVSAECGVMGDGVAALRHATLVDASPSFYAPTGADMNSGVVTGFEGCLSVFRWGEGMDQQ